MHHIVPKSLGGNESIQNLVLLTAREHFIAHMLLVRIVRNKDTYRMINAMRRFKNKVQNSLEYNLLKNTMSRYSKGEYNPSFGKIWIHNIHTQEILYVLNDEFELMSNTEFKKGLPYQRGGFKNRSCVNDSNKQLYVPNDLLQSYLDNGWILGKLIKPDINHMRYMSSKRHTREKDNEHSKKMTGDKHFNYGKPAFTKGKIWINNSIISKMINPDTLDDLVVDGWKKGRLLK